MVLRAIHARTDAGGAAQIRHRAQGFGVRAYFSPANLRAGGSWTAQLAQEIAGANAFILLVGEHGVGDWQVLEYDEALDKRVKSPGFPLIVVLLEGQTAPGLPFLRRLHWIITSDPASERDVARVFDAASGGGARPGELWRYASPYRGLAAMEERDSDYFFGRKRETADVLSALAGAPDRLPVLIGNSGVGKSSLAQAGVLAALKRQAWPEEGGASNAWPPAFQDSRQWCFLTLRPGADPLKALVDAFLDTWQFAATDPERATRQNGWIEALLEGKATLLDLIDATERRRKELDQPRPPASLLYIDQGEELYVRAEEPQRRRFSELLVHALPDKRLRTIMSMRSDFLGHLQTTDRSSRCASRSMCRRWANRSCAKSSAARPSCSRRGSKPTGSSTSSPSGPRRTRSRTWALCRSCPIRSTTCGRRWRAMATGRCAFQRNPSNSGAFSSSAPTSFSRSHPGAKTRCGAC